MKIKAKLSVILREKTLISCTVLSCLIIGLLAFEQGALKTEAAFNIEKITLSIAQGNSLLPIADPSGPEPKVVQKMTVILTAYSSTPEETDNDPFITAAGTWVRDGIVANNLLPFGTKIKIPEIYGDKVFIVEDRMNWKKSNYHFDIWFPSYWGAKNFGVERTYIEILES